MNISKMFNIVIVLSLIIGCSISFTAIADENVAEDVAPLTLADWQLEKKHDHFKVFSREKIDSGFLQIKAEVLFLANTDKVLAHFGDGNECWAWQARCNSSKIIKVLNEQEKLVYTTLNMPWPLSDRDFIFHSLQMFDPVSQVTTLSLSPSDSKMKKSKYVRAKSNILYSVEPIENTSTKLTIVMHTDLGGDISPSFVNGKLADELYDDIETLISLVKKANND